MLGIHHIGNENYYNLADDFIEVFRPIIDNFVFQNVSLNDDMTSELKEKLMKILLTEWCYKNQKTTFFNLIDKFIGNCFNFLKDGLEYEEFILDEQL